MVQRNGSGRGGTATKAKATKSGAKKTAKATKAGATRPAGAGRSSATAPAGRAPTVSRNDIARMTVTEIRGQLRRRGVTGISALRKDDLVDSLVRTLRAENRRKPTPSRSGTATRATEPRRGRRATGSTTRSGGTGVRAGAGSSRSLKYAQPITAEGERPDRPGRSLVTTNHEVIRNWARARDAEPATISGTEREGRAGVLTFNFPGYREGGKLRKISWTEWFDTFDTRQLNFIYQETRTNGQPSNFFRTESPGREDG